MSEINERGVGPPVELAHFPTPGSWSPWGGRPWGDAGLRSAECSSLKEAPGLPGVSGCFWRLWEGGTWRGQTRGKSASETEGQGEVVVLKCWQGSEGTLGPMERKGSINLQTVCGLTTWVLGVEWEALQQENHQLPPRQPLPSGSFQTFSNLRIFIYLKSTQ